VKRRDFITLLGGAAAAWPLAARAQQPGLPVVGFFSGLAREAGAPFIAAFRHGLHQTGRNEGRDVQVDDRWAEGQYDRLPGLANELVHLPATVIVATGGAPPSAKAATTTIPIVFVMGEADPVKTGLVVSLNRPGGNITGIFQITSVLGPKRLELLHELVPGAGVMGMLLNPYFPDSEMQAREAQIGALSLGLQLHIENASTDRDLDKAFATFAEQKVGALLVGNDVFFMSRHKQLAAFTARLTLPAMYSFREYVADGGLMSYGPSLSDAYRQAGVYAGRILNGEKPGDLPVLQPTKYEFVINLKTAKALGLQIPDKLLALADEVID
jgi:putative tryptophan/tyrosine transport system substrate-binding protein